MFDHFSDQARRIVLASREEAAATSRGPVDTGHLLAALARERGSVSARVLYALGLSYTNLRWKASVVAETMQPQMHGPEALFAPDAHQVLVNAAAIAVANADTRVGTEHILLAMLLDGECLGTKTLAAMDTPASAVTERLEQMLEAGEQDGDGDSAAASESLAARLGAKPTDASPRRGKHEAKKSKTKFLDALARNLTEAARNGELDPMVGREEQVARAMQVLCRRAKNNPVLVGEPGVGKSAIVEGLASLIVSGQVPEILAEATIYSLDMGLLVAGTKYRGEFEERMKGLMEELAANPNAIVFIDEIHTVVGAGSSHDSTMDAGNLLKPALARGAIRVIGATTLDEYRKYIEKDAALERRFAPVEVPEPSVADTTLILAGLRDVYASHHNVTYTDEALSAAARLADRYVRDRFLPDKAIDLMDEAGARARIAQMAGGDAEPTVLDAEAIAVIVSSMTGVPVTSMDDAETGRLQQMEMLLAGRVIGQDEAIRGLSRAVRRSRAGLKDPKRPAGSFIFAGPTGVGKTETAKALAEFLFGTENALISIDMSEFAEQHSVSRLFGAPPGYVGHEDGGELTEKIRRRPYSVVLFDEVEKAHPEVFNTLLQVLDEGRMTDGHGRVVDFANTLIIMTTNLGSAEIAKGIGLGFADALDERSQAERLTQRVTTDLKAHFRPEFLNRVDATIVFHPLSIDAVTTIVDLMVAQVQQRVTDHGITITLDDAARTWLAQEGWHPTMGARPLRRAIQTHVEDALADLIVSGALTDGNQVNITVVDGALVCEPALEAVTA